MSELRVDSVKSKGGGAPDLPKGVTISGIATAATLGATTVDVSNVNVSGVVTSGTLNGPLLSTGTPTLGLGVTINSSGLHITGVATAGIVSATTLYGDGTNVTGVGASIAPLFYNPDPYDTLATIDTGIGITFNQQVKAGTGNVTLSIANAGVAGTVVENFGVGSSVSISENRITINPTADLTGGEAQYFISYPSGAFTNNEGTDYVGTGYTFGTREYLYQLWTWGYQEVGTMGQNNNTDYSSPIQIPGTTWSAVGNLPGRGLRHVVATKTDGTLWSWGLNESGELGLDDIIDRSSPTQIPGTTWGTTSVKSTGAYLSSGAVKTDATLWIWGSNDYGQLGLNNRTKYSSPTQVPGTTWSTISGGQYIFYSKKTDGTLWTWGRNYYGDLGQNDRTNRSSPVQIPGTTWNKISPGNNFTLATKTDGTLWWWGMEEYGQSALNGPVNVDRSSPTQIPGTDWNDIQSTSAGGLATRTDGTLWTWGANGSGQLGLNSPDVKHSSPTQVPGTTWSKVGGRPSTYYSIRTDGTLWAWGSNANGELGQNDKTQRSSPVQIPGTAYDTISCGYDNPYVIKKA